MSDFEPGSSAMLVYECQTYYEYQCYEYNVMCVVGLLKWYEYRSTKNVEAKLQVTAINAVLLLTKETRQYINAVWKLYVKSI